MLVVYFTVITDNLQSTNHLADCEETEHLCKDDSVGCPLLAIGISDLAQGLSGGGRNGARDRLWVSDHICKWLEIRLEAGD